MRSWLTGSYTTIFQESIWRTLPRPQQPSKNQAERFCPVRVPLACYGDAS